MQFIHIPHLSSSWIDGAMKAVVRVSFSKISLLSLGPNIVISKSVILLSASALIKPTGPVPMTEIFLKACSIFNSMTFLEGRSFSGV